MKSMIINRIRARQARAVQLRCKPDPVSAGAIDMNECHRLAAEKADLIVGMSYPDIESSTSKALWWRTYALEFRSRSRP